MRTFLIWVKGRDSPKVRVEADYDHLGQCSLQITAGLAAADLLVQELPTEAHPPQARRDLILPMLDMAAARELAGTLKQMGFDAIPLSTAMTVHKR